MSRSGARAASRFSRLVQSEPLVLRMHRSEFSAAIVARPSGWLTSTFRMAICRDTHNPTPQLETALNVVLPGWAVYGGRLGKVERNTEKEAKWHTVRDNKAPVLDVGQEFFLKACARLRATLPQEITPELPPGSRPVSAGKGRRGPLRNTRRSYSAVSGLRCQVIAPMPFCSHEYE